MPLLELRGVERAYAASTGEVSALRGVDLVVEPGEFVLVVGPSGAGKTSLLHVAALLDPPTRGRVAFDGADVSRAEPHELAALRLAHVGLVFQHHYLVPDLTVLENVALPALAKGAPAAEADAQARALLDRMGLAHTHKRVPRELSGGEQQRAGLARALVNAPRLLVCDEPTGDLDPASADVVAGLLAEAHARGATLLVATHEPARFPQATRRVRIEGGRVVGSDWGDAGVRARPTE